MNRSIREFRMMVYDKSIKEYILDLEFTMEDIHIDSIQLPKQSNYKYKFQQYINQKWIDSSRFVNLVLIVRLKFVWYFLKDCRKWL